DRRPHGRGSGAAEGTVADSDGTGLRSRAETRLGARRRPGRFLSRKPWRVAHFRQNRTRGGRRTSRLRAQISHCTGGKFGRRTGQGPGDPGRPDAAWTRIGRETYRPPRLAFGRRKRKATPTASARGRT